MICLIKTKDELPRKQEIPRSQGKGHCNHRPVVESGRLNPHSATRRFRRPGPGQRAVSRGHFRSERHWYPEAPWVFSDVRLTAGFLFHLLGLTHLPTKQLAVLQNLSVLAPHLCLPLGSLATPGWAGGCGCLSSPRWLGDRQAEGAWALLVLLVTGELCLREREGASRLMGIQVGGSESLFT